MQRVLWAPRNAAYKKFFSAVLAGDVAALDSETFCADFNFDALRPNRYLEGGDDDDVTNNAEGAAALHIAAANGHIEMVKFLLARGADVNVQDESYVSIYTPLLVAASNSNAEMVEVLLDHGADINQMGDHFEGTALHLVLWWVKKVEQKSIDTIKLLLNRGMDVNATSGEYGCTVLHRAAELGHKGLIRFLLGRGANINAHSYSGTSVLGSAARSGTCDTVKFLLGRGAIIDSPALGSSGLACAAGGGNMDVLKLLLGRAQRSVIDSCHHSIQTAVFGEHTDAVELLLDYGFNIEAVNNCGETPLVSVCSLTYLRSSAVIDCLLRRGADVTARGRGGDTALHRALLLNTPDAVKSLIAAGSDIEARNNSGATPLICFPDSPRVGIRHMVALKILLDAGADVNARDKRGRNALHMLDRPSTDEKLKIELARELLERGVDINARDQDGATPLGRLEMKFFNEAFAAFLVAHGAVE